jgi:hypothetical protein
MLTKILSKPITKCMLGIECKCNGGLVDQKGKGNGNG